VVVSGWFGELTVITRPPPLNGPLSRENSTNLN
jgi:hypothetical protein